MDKPEFPLEFESVPGARDEWNTWPAEFQQEVAESVVQYKKLAATYGDDVMAAALDQAVKMLEQR